MSLIIALIAAAMWAVLVGALLIGVNPLSCALFTFGAVLETLIAIWSMLVETR